ncbi:MAG: DUF1501 domain-containing protein [Planctomycetota bacterium]|jgi:hypothetical protein|nr:MAG: DUF1501 domain-containing protein [Planctomycetota bacterium]
MSDLCCNRIPLACSRRDMLRLAACGFGSIAFAAMAARASGVSAMTGGDDDDTATNPLAAKKPHFAPTAKRIIFLCMAGAPSHIDTFDYKPELALNDGTVFRGNSKLLASPWKFKQSGKSGLWISDLFPNLQKQADNMCLLRGMKAEIPAHAQASIQLHTGSFQFVRPSMGAWALYGLGTENENLPGFIAINPRGDNGGAQLYGSGFLPASYQATPVRIGGGRNAGSGDAIPHISNDRLGVNMQREQLDLVQRLNKERLKREQSDAQLEGVIESYELAFRMQAEVPDLVSFDNEDKKTLEMYGVGAQPTDSFARQCLLARRFAEQGVRFIEVSHGGWDTHRNLRTELEKQCGEIDQPIAALLADLKQRGMLDETLVLWGGEFGRTPYAQNGDGRDHNAKGFTMWMAGGGVKGGMSFGSTDEIGAEAVDGVMDIHDLHATMLHIAGLDHERLTYKHAGRNFRLTDVKGKVNTAILRA